MNDSIDGFYLDDGTKVDPNLVDKPGLCISCSKNNDPSEEVLCTLTRIDQQGESEFICHAYSQISD
jgi:hypothetical protein